MWRRSTFFLVPLSFSPPPSRSLSLSTSPPHRPMSESEEQQLRDEERRDEQTLQNLRLTARRAFREAEQELRRSSPRSRARAMANVDNCRRVLICLSGAFPSSSDEDRRTTGSRQSPEEEESESEYYTTSSTSSGGSSERDLDEKEAILAEYSLSPVAVISRFQALDEAAAIAASTASTSKLPPRPQHDAACRGLRDKMARCDCTLKKARHARRLVRRQERLRRWFATTLAQEEASVDADDEEEQTRWVIYAPHCAPPFAEFAPSR
ncbi:hypothetical protein DFH06DRAFT_1327905 [Mycena polygramma]|nr:hypothetical protein DFH06DRAFT_1327905 [Mycena polygramma]